PGPGPGLLRLLQDGSLASDHADGDAGERALRPSVSRMVSASARPGAIRLGAGGRRRGVAGGLHPGLESASIGRGLGGGFLRRGTPAPFAAPVNELEKLLLAELALADDRLDAALQALAIGRRQVFRGV